MALGFSPSDSVRAKENLSDELIIPVIAQLYELFKREIPGKFVPQLSMDSPSFDALITGSKRRSTNASEKSSKLTSPSPSQMSKRTVRSLELLYVVFLALLCLYIHEPAPLIRFQTEYDPVLPMVPSPPPPLIVINYGVLFRPPLFI